MRTWKALRVRTSFVVALAAAVSSLGCGGTDGDGGTGPGPGGGSNPTVNAMSSGIDEAVKTYLDGNQGAYESVAVFGALAAQIFTKPHVAAAKEPGRGMDRQECLNPELFGTTYAFNGSEYAASERTGAPANGVRFVVYEVQGGVATTNEIGHLDVSCTGTPTRPNLQVSLVIHDVTILSITTTGNVNPNNGGASLFHNGFLSSSDGTKTQPFEGGVSRAGAPASRIGHSFSFRVLPELEIAYGELHDGGTEVLTTTAAAIGGPVNRIDWEVRITLDAMLDGAINSGATEWSDGFSDGELWACVSGSVANASFLNAQEAGCTPVFYQSSVPTSLDPADLANMTAAYHGLRELYLALRQFADVGLAVLTPPAG